MPVQTRKSKDTAMLKICIIICILLELESLWCVVAILLVENHYLFLPFSEENKTTKLKYTFTPMHGVGQRFASLAFEAFNLPPFVSVREQVDVQL